MSGIKREILAVEKGHDGPDMKRGRKRETVKASWPVGHLQRDRLMRGSHEGFFSLLVTVGKRG